MPWDPSDNQRALDYDVTRQGDFLIAAALLYNDVDGGTVLAARCDMLASGCDDELDWTVSTVHPYDTEFVPDAASLSLTADPQRVWLAYTDFDAADTSTLVRAICGLTEPTLCGGAPPWVVRADAVVNGETNGLFPRMLDQQDHRLEKIGISFVWRGDQQVALQGRHQQVLLAACVSHSGPMGLQNTSTIMSKMGKSPESLSWIENCRLSTSYS